MSLLFVAARAERVGRLEVRRAGAPCLDTVDANAWRWYFFPLRRLPALVDSSWRGG